jgi:hypothetical protein
VKVTLRCEASQKLTNVSETLIASTIKVLEAVNTSYTRQHCAICQQAMIFMLTAVRT